MTTAHDYRAPSLVETLSALVLLCLGIISACALVYVVNL